MNRIQQSLKWKLVTLCMIVFAATFAIVHVSVYVMTREAIEEQIQLSAQAVVISVACYIMEDIESYKAFIETFVDTKKENASYGDDEYYQKMHGFFAKIKANSNVKYVYTERKLDSENLEFILDAEPIGTPDHSPPGSTDPNDPHKERIYTDTNHLPTNAGVDYYGKDWGYLIVAYAPIFDHDGKFLGTAGVDVEAHHINTHLNRLQLVLFVIYTCVTGAVLAVLMQYAGTILEPLYKDKLTGAYIKRYSEKLIHEEIVAATKEHRDLALFMLDLDHFKKINDTYGHGFGDHVLSSVSETIRSSLRQRDYFIRYGGEEFIMVIPSVHEQRAIEIAERIRRAIEGHPIYHEKREISVYVTISIGIATFDRPTLSAMEFIENADRALYEAKKNRNCVAVCRHNRSHEKTSLFLTNFEG